MQASAVIDDARLSARSEASRGVLPIRFEAVGFSAGDPRSALET